MNKNNFMNLYKGLCVVLVKHAPEILTGIGVVGMVASTVLAVNSTPKVLEIIEDKKNELYKDSLTVSETVRATWKCYVPSAITFVASLACFMGAASVNARRNAAIATAYKLSETAFLEYRDSVVKTVGAGKEQVVRDKIAQDRVDKNPVSSTEVIITNKGATLCYDKGSDRYFLSDIETINKSVNNLNRRMLGDGYVSINDLYYEIGLDCTSEGDEYGWNVNKGFIDLKFSATISSDGRPCIVLDYYSRPFYGYQSM